MTAEFPTYQGFAPIAPSISSGAAELVRLAWTSAPRHCSSGASGCATYHRIRPLLRRLGLAAEPSDQHNFLFSSISAALQDVGPRVLVSGTADDAMAVMVLEAAQSVDKVVALTVLDRCPTPTMLNKAFCDTQDVAATIAVADILDFRATEKFDLIVTHSFLGPFSPSARRRLISVWFDLLKPGGRVATVARLRPDGRVVSFSEDAAAAFAEEVRRRAQAVEEDTGITAAEAANLAMVYARQRSNSYPLYSADDLGDLFATEGFNLLRLDVQDFPGRISGLDGPGLPRPGKYVQVLAGRPD